MAQKTLKNFLFKLQDNNLYFSNLKIANSYLLKRAIIRDFKFESIPVIWNYPEETYRLEDGKFLTKIAYGVHELRERVQ